MTDWEKRAFFESIQRQEREHKERRAADPELHKRHMLKSMSNGFGRNQQTRKVKVSLPKLSILEDK